MAASERKRPWYLLLSLLAALAFGAQGARNGWTTVMLYREPIDPSMAGQGIVDESDRAAVVAYADAYVQALDAAKSRGWPLSIATLLLGASILFFAMRAVGGSGSARIVLVQLLVAQAGVNAATHWLMGDVQAAELRWTEARLHAADSHEHVPEEVLRAAAAIVLAVQLVGSALIVVALTRRRSREFFDATAAALGER
jgi:hypothetical protein